jgi:hypothetical protein
MNSKGQLFTSDLLVALLVTLVSIGVALQMTDYQIQQSSSSVESAKMHQIAMDGAALQYYRGEFAGFDTSVQTLRYAIGTADCSDADTQAMVVSTRGTAADTINVYVCR